jgi:outer membrane protein OmpA-like peptidoglycan-associated protein
VPDIYFDFSKHEINLVAKRQLEEVARELKSNSALRVHIRGHSDKLGGPAQNLTLSGMRARAIKYYLTVIGVAEDRITTEALGDTEPADPEDTPVAWAKNRRVQIVWR